MYGITFYNIIECVLSFLVIFAGLFPVFYTDILYFIYISVNWLLTRENISVTKHTYMLTDVSRFFFLADIFNSGTFRSTIAWYFFMNFFFYECLLWTFLWTQISINVGFDALQTHKHLYIIYKLNYMHTIHFSIIISCSL